MSVSLELLEAFKASQGGLSDYRVAKLIGVAQPTITKYKQGMAPISAEKVLLMCKIAGFDEVDWLLRLYLERARSTDEITAIESLRNLRAA